MCRAANHVITKSAKAASHACWHPTYLSILASYRVESALLKISLSDKTYRENKIHDVHEHQYCVTCAHLSVPIREHEQCHSDNVVCKHLPVILATLFNVDNEDLLHPEGGL